ncbi:nuclear transport factor 2 family protein [cf. Phormidesmis sp. LEGE 11477]|nr:nuclear transport factor 2 family protein [cf. Phormidesmis sp. LEGE 11477]
MVAPLVIGIASGLAISIGAASAAKAAPAESAPPELTAAIENMETAASERDLTAVMDGYSPSFSNEDGFTYETLETALQTFWDRYTTLSYRVELQSWEPTSTGFLAETVTYVSGTQIDNGQSRELESIIRSRQAYQDGKIISQETLSERNQMTSGEKPPSVSVILAEQVESGEQYDFDAIVLEPLGNRYLLGGVIDEGVTSTDFFAGRPVELELLSAGGLFKIGEAPDTPDSRWVSALLVREDGVTIVTRRLQVN